MALSNYQRRVLYNTAFLRVEELTDAWFNVYKEKDWVIIGSPHAEKINLPFDDSEPPVYRLHVIPKQPIVGKYEEQGNGSV